MKPKKTILDNGLRIVTVPMKEDKTISIVIAVTTGADYESKDENGISHFLEHMCFNGTENYPTARDIALELDNIGAQYNATTSRETTKYYGTAHNKHTKHLFSVLADMYLNPIFPDADVLKERKVIVEEINMYNDDPQSVVWIALNKLLYEDQPAGRTVLGIKKNVQQMTAEKLREYQRKHYVPQETIVTLSGGISHREGVSLAKDLFAEMQEGKKHKRIRTKEIQKKPRAQVVYKKTDQAHIRLAFRTTHTKNEKDMWPLMVLRDILSGGTSSRLWQSVREDRGLCYYVDAGLTDYQDRGTLVFSAGVANNRVEEAIEAILEEVSRVINEPVDKKELQKVRDAYASRLVLGKQTSSAYAQFYSAMETSGISLYTLPEMIRKYRAVEVKDIQRVAKKHFKNDRLNLALIGPFKNGKRFEKLLKID